MKKILLLLGLLGSSLTNNAQSVSTFAGSNTNSGFAEGIAVGTQSQFFRPIGVCTDAGGTMYVADTYNHRIRKITTDGHVSTIAGSTQGFMDGTGVAAQFNYPNGICIDGNGNLYVTDEDNNRIRKITPTGVVSTFAGSTAGLVDGIGSTAKFREPKGICIDISGNLYVTDYSNNKIRKISSAGIVSTIAGSATFSVPHGICIDSSGNLFIADTGSYKIIKITSAGVVSDFAGSTSGFLDGTGAGAQFSYPTGIAIDISGNLFVTDMNIHRIRKISPAGVVTTFSGSGALGVYNGQGTEAQFNGPTGVCVGANGDINIADTYNNRIRKITPNGLVSTYAGFNQGNSDGITTVAQFSLPDGLCSDPSGNIYVADYGNHKIRKITPSGIVSTFVGSQGSTSGYADGSGSAVRFNYPKAVCRDSNGNFYVTDRDNFKIRKITPSGVVSTLAGSTQGYLDGSGASAKFGNSLDGICADSNGNIYVVDESNYKIRKITPSGVVSTLAGSTFGYADGPGNSAKFWQPRGICIDASGNLYVSERFNHKIRKITPAGFVSTLAGSTEGYTDGPGATAQFSYPEHIAIDSNGNLYLNDYALGNYLIRKITPTGNVSTVAGSTVGYTDGPVMASQFSNLLGICTDATGNIYVSDSNNKVIRKIGQTLGINENYNLRIGAKIYPNPTNEIINIEIEGIGENTAITIINLLGEKMLYQKIVSSITSINVSNLAKGIYFLTLTDGTKKTIQKVIIE